MLQGMLDKLVRGEHLTSWILEKTTVEHNFGNFLLRDFIVGFILAQTEVLQGILYKLVRGDHLARWIIEKATVAQNTGNLFQCDLTVCFVLA